MISCLLTHYFLLVLLFQIQFLFKTISSVDYEVVVEDEAAMVDLAEKVVSEMSDSDASDAFTTKLTATMKTNGVTSVEVNDIKADTTKVPTNAGTSGGEIPEVGGAYDTLGGGHKNGGANLIVATLLVVTAAVMIM